MKHELIIYHGSQQIVEMPKFSFGKKYNDYGQGFYCTENLELAKEWACPVKNDGYACKYRLNPTGLNVVNLTSGSFNILSWLAVLLANRKFDITSPVGKSAREFILDRFWPDAEDFVNNMISLRDLNLAMRLGNLGEQVVLLSEKAFGQIEFMEYTVADYREYYYKRAACDKKARASYADRKKNLQQLRDDIFVMDIIREDMKYDDPRLQSAISE